MCFGPLFCWTVFLLIHRSSVREVPLLGKLSHFCFNLKCLYFYFVPERLFCQICNCTWQSFFFFNKRNQFIHSHLASIAASESAVCLIGILFESIISFCSLLRFSYACYLFYCDIQIRKLLILTLCLSAVQTINWVLDFTILFHFLKLSFFKIYFIILTCAFLFLAFISLKVSYTLIYNLYLTIIVYLILESVFFVFADFYLWCSVSLSTCRSLIGYRCLILIGGTSVRLNSGCFSSKES